MVRKRNAPAVGSREKLGITMNEVVKGGLGVSAKSKPGAAAESSGVAERRPKRSRTVETVVTPQLSYMEQLIAEGFGGGIDTDEPEESEHESNGRGRVTEEDASETVGSYQHEDEYVDDDDEAELVNVKSKRAKGKGVLERSRRCASDKLGEVRAAVLGRLVDPLPQQFQQQQQQQLAPDNRPLGVIVKEKERVVETQVLNCVRRPANVVCRVDAFSKLISELDDSRVNVVQEMGFGALLNLKITRLDRKFCYWLLTRVDPDSNLFVFGDGKELPLCPVQWNLVLGIPFGRSVVPLACDGVDENMQARIRAIGGWFGTVDPSGRTHLSIGEADDVLHFKSAFLVVVLGQLLCPTTDGGNLSISLLPAVSVAAEAKNYNWCEFASDWLMTYVSKFKVKFDKYGFVSECGGCTLFLMIYYIDHLSRTPLFWNETPRINVWTQSAVMAVIEADRKVTGDFGKLESVDVAYGERHPRIARDRRIPPDLMGSSSEDVIVRRVVRLLDPRLEYIESLLEKLLKRKRAKPSGPSERVEEPLEQTINRIAAEAILCDVNGVETEMNNDSVLGDNNQNKGRDNDVEDGGDREVRRQNLDADGGGGQGVLSNGGGGKEYVDLEVGGNGQGSNGGNGNAEALGEDAGTELPMDSSDKGGAVGEKSPSKVANMKAPKERSSNKSIRAEVVVPAEKARVLGVVARKILTMIRNFSPRTDKTRGIPLIECQGMDATTVDCHGVLFMRDRVSYQYVRMAAKLYSCEWAKEFEGKRRRIMIDVTFTERVIAGEETAEVAAAKHGGNLKGVGCKNLAALFLPVIEKEHWWCAAFDMIEEKIYVIDSMSSDGATEHNAVLMKLACAVDVLLKTFDKAWASPTVCYWPTQNVEVKQTDNQSCGIIMLLCIKECAYGFMERFLVESLKDARDGLLFDDLHSEFNELKPKFEELVADVNELK